MDYFMSIRTWKTNNKHLHVHTRTITVSSTHGHQSVTYTYFLVFLPHTAKRVWASKYHTWNFLILSYPKAIFLKTKKIPGQHTVLNLGVVRHSWERASQEVTSNHLAPCRVVNVVLEIPHRIRWSAQPGTFEAVHHQMGLVGTLIWGK